MRKRNTIWWACCLAIVILTPWQVLHASVVMDAPIETLVVDAEAAFLGRVLRTGTQIRVQPQGDVVVETVTTVQVERWLKRGTRFARLASALGAKQKPETIEIREEGGVVGDTEIVVEGVPRYVPGQEVVLFVDRHRVRTVSGLSVTKSFVTHAMALGKFDVHRGRNALDSFVKRDGHGVSVAKWKKGDWILGGASEPAMQLQEFINFVQRQASALETK